jgi:hypothetical protein
MPDGITDANKAIADSKKVLANANRFQSSAGGPLMHTPPHEFSHAPYSLVSKAKETWHKATNPEAESIHEASDTAAGIKSRLENQKAVQ